MLDSELGHLIKGKLRPRPLQKLTVVLWLKERRGDDSVPFVRPVAPWNKDTGYLLSILHKLFMQLAILAKIWEEKLLTWEGVL